MAMKSSIGAHQFERHSTITKAPIDHALNVGSHA